MMLMYHDIHAPLWMNHGGARTWGSNKTCRASLIKKQHIAKKTSVQQEQRDMAQKASTVSLGSKGLDSKGFRWASVGPLLKPLFACQHKRIKTKKWSKRGPNKSPGRYVQVYSSTTCGQGLFCSLRVWWWCWCIMISMHHCEWIMEGQGHEEVTKPAEPPWLRSNT